MKYPYARRQLTALAFVASLAPAVRLMPKMCARLGGGSGWLSPLIALPFLILYSRLLSEFLSMRKSGEGLGELILRTNGRALGSAVLFLTAAYLIFCCGFILRSGAERFICTIYPEGGAWPFVAVMLAIGTLAVLGPERALVRAAKIFAPLLAAVLPLIIVLALPTLDLNMLLPVAFDSVGAALLSALPTLEIFAGMLAYTAFLEGRCTEPRRGTAAYSLWLVPVCILLTLMCAACIGSYGAELTADFSYPFFSMIRNLTLFNTIERIEAIVVTLWVLPDFIIYVLMLGVAGHILRLVLGFVPEDNDVPWLKMSNGRWIIAAASVLVLGVAALLNLDAENIELYSELIVPAGNLAVVLVLIPASLLVARLRR